MFFLIACQAEKGELFASACSGDGDLRVEGGKKHPERGGPEGLRHSVQL